MSNTRKRRRLYRQRPILRPVASLAHECPCGCDAIVPRYLYPDGTVIIDIRRGAA